MKCPFCGSEDISKVIYNHTVNDTEKRGVDLFSAACGYLIFGWLGLLFGLDESEKTTTRTYKREGYICNNCKSKLKRKK